MKILVIMHANNLLYGAGKSLVNWVTNTNIEIDVLRPKAFPRSVKEEVIRQGFGNNVKEIYTMWLPFSRCYSGRMHVSKLGFLYQKMNNILWRMNRKKVKNLMKKYDKVYLNSLVLWPLISSKGNYYIHIREVFEGSNRLFKEVLKSLRDAKGIIYIDHATYEVFKNYNLKNEIVLNNPFDMRNVKFIQKDKIKKNLELKENKKIYSIIGMIYEQKGVEFVIDGFVKADIDAYLLIAGKKKGQYAQKCIKKAEKYNNIIFLGEIEDINKIYAISNAVIRGEKFFCVGRTIYEGLYSGNDVIIPGNEQDIERLPNIEKCKENIYFYEPRNVESFVEALKKAEKKKEGRRIYISKVEEYTNKILKFMELNNE